MKPYKGNLIRIALENTYFRQVLYTAKGGQLVVMSLKPSEDIGLEVHDDVDQFFWVVQGTAKAVLSGKESEVATGEVLVVPRGTNHNIVNASATQALKLFTVYTPPNHPDGTLHKTRAAALKAHHD